MRWRGRERSMRTMRTDAKAGLATINRMSRAVRHGLDHHAAQAIADAVADLLSARSVAVTHDDDLLATAGEALPWHESIAERSRVVLERRRSVRPTLYQVMLERSPVDVAVAVFTRDGLPAGTIHAAMGPGADLDLAELHEVAALVSTQLELAELEQSRLDAAEAELRALRAQVSPHFLHNALTAIAALVGTNPARAQELIATLAEFLRSTFRSTTDLTTVADELRLVETYLELEHARWGDRFDIRLNIAPESLPVPVPFLTIQPLVENAIRHGLEKRPGPGRLTIVAENAGPEIAIHVEDDGVGIEPEVLQAAIEGADDTVHVGVVAVDTRLRSHFGDEFGLTISTGTNAGTKVTIRVPKSSPG